MLITLNDYKRIYKVINSVIKNEGADPAHSCLYFSAFGAYILNHHYKLEAQSHAGLAAYHLGNDNELLVFAEEGEGGVSANGDAFHCWVEVNDWAIDFTAPAFSELKSGDIEIPARMFQRPLSDMAESINHMNKSGDFFYYSTPELTTKHMQILNSHKMISDLADICNRWFVKPPKKIQKSIQIGNQRGELGLVTLHGHNIIGKW